MIAMDVRVRYHYDGSWWADSSDLPGYTAAAESLSELRELVREGARVALEDEQVRVLDDFGDLDPLDQERYVSRLVTAARAISSGIGGNGQWQGSLGGAVPSAV